MSKPREWWICDVWEPVIGTRQVLDADPGELGKDIDVFHVIEKSAYDVILAQAEAMAEALNGVLAFPAVPYESVGGYTKAKQAVTTWQKFKGEL